LPTATAGAAVDTALIATERALLGPGLPGRPWYRHELYAPGQYTGYDVKTMPAIREAIEIRDWPGAQAGIAAVSAALTRYAAAIDAATSAKRVTIRHTTSAVRGLSAG
jgi:N-acetylated-alpha-linked acidic dipeptidase